METNQTLTELALSLVQRAETSNAFGRRLPEFFTEPRLEDATGHNISITDAHKASPRIIILGNAGAGKTTLLLFYAYQDARKFLENPNKTPCPIFIKARFLSTNPHSSHVLLDQISAASSFESSPPISTTLLTDMMEEGRVRLYIDGLDELISDRREFVLSELMGITRRFPKSPMVLSTRPATLTTAFHGFRTYTIPRFDFHQVQILVKRLSASRPEMAERFSQILFNQHDLSDLASSPLLLNLLWAVFERYGTIRTNPTFLYSDFTDYLLSTWDEAKLIGPRTKLTLAGIQKVIERLAVSLYEQGRNTFLIDDLDAIMNDLFGADVRSSSVHLEEIGASGLFQRDPDGKYSFVHKSFVEYYVARAIYRDPQKMMHLLDDQDADPILVFACGLIEDVAPVIEAAVERGKVVLAAKCISRGRTCNEQLVSYVVKEFTREIGQPFIDLLSKPCGNGEVLATSAENTHLDLLTLLDSSLDTNLPNHLKGAKFEDFSVALFGTVFKVISQDLNTENGELDLVLEIEIVKPFWLEFGGDALVECKNWNSGVPVKEVGAFLAKVNQARVKLGFFVSMSGFTDDAMRTLRNNGANVTAPLVVPITGASIRQALNKGLFLEEFFKDQIRTVKYLRKY